ncbi:MAG: D-aminoacyl-tRNA deacylase [Candidatus Altarchaeaceae archaeon]
MKIILYSSVDEAGKNIAKFLNERKEELEKNNAKIFELNEKIIYIQEIPKEILDYVKEKNEKIDVIIVASRHKSESEIPTLCVHSPGNFNDAKFGGKEKTLSIAPALYIRKALIEFFKEKERKNLNYDVTLEVTHHGPTLNFPILFVEVGSSEKQWNDLNACESAANVIENLCKYNPELLKIAVGIGGNHYAEKFTKKIKEENFAIGHIMPKYNFNEEMIKQMIEKTYPNPNIVLIDWKGLNGEQKKKTLKVIEEIGIKYEKI